MSAIFAAALTAPEPITIITSAGLFGSVEEATGVAATVRRLKSEDQNPKRLTAHQQRKINRQ